MHGQTVASTLDIDGGDDEAINTTFELANPAAGFTIEFWVNFDNFGGYQAPVSQTSGSLPAPFDIYASGNRLSFLLGNGNAATTIFSPQLAAGCWYHFATVYDPADIGNEHKVYMDGVLVGASVLSVAPGNSTPSGPNELMLGTRKDGVTQLNGQLDDVRIWSTVRTPTEISTNKNCELTGGEAGLEVFYDMSEVGITVNGANTGLVTISDKTANGHNATLSGMALNGTASNFITQTSTVNATCNGDYAEINVQGVGIDLTDGQTTTSGGDDTDFGMVCTSVTNTYTIQNPGNLVLNISSITSTHGDFVISGAPGTVGGGSSETFDVSFTPSSTGTISSTISIDNDDCDEDPFTFAVEGIGATSTTSEPGKGEMLDFDGSNDYVISGSNTGISGTAPRTIEAWIYQKGNTGHQFPVCLGNSSATGSDFKISFNSGFYQFWWHNGGFNTGYAVALNEWHHFAATYDGTTIRTYVDGAPTPTPSSVYALNTSDAPITLGTRPDLSCCYANVVLDEVRVWDVERTQDEIQANMNLTLGDCHSDLIAYYQFNDGASSSTVTDRSGNGNNGTLTQMDPANDWLESEVPAGSGTYDKVSVTSTGVTNFPNTEVTIDFGDNPNGDITITRLNGLPHGWETLGVNIDDEYFVIHNYGSNQTPAINSMVFDNITEIPMGTNPADIRLHKRESNEFGGTWGTLISAASNLTNFPSATVTYTGAPLTTGFSQFVNVSPNIPFPVELFNFEAVPFEENKVKLTWLTASELNNEGFEVLHSMDGTDWNNIGYVKGQGTSTESHTYTYVDDEPSIGFNYYRLKQVNADGRVVFSNIVDIVFRQENNRLRLFPNPTSGSVILSLDSEYMGEASLSVFDAMGKQVERQTLSMPGQSFETEIKLSKLPKGVYWIKVNTGKYYFLERLMIK